jgi:hypothetical protein
MSRRFGLALGACAIVAAVSPALALDPPAKVRLFHYGTADVGVAYVDFASLDRGDPIMLSGWTYTIYTPPKPIDGLEKPIGSYWEKIDADCGTYSIISHGVVALTPDDAVIFESNDDTSERRDAAPGTLEESLLKLICSGKEPTDGSNPFATAAEAERTVRVTEEMDRAMDNIEQEFGTGGDADDYTLDPFSDAPADGNDAPPK